jgi:hypothetical protein
VVKQHDDVEEGMSMEEIQARHLVELGFLEDIFNEKGYTTHLVEKSSEIPYHTLLVDLEADAAGRPRQMALTYYPVSEEDVDYILLLQYFLELPFDVKPAQTAAVAELLAYINSKVVLGHFGVTEGKAKLHYRYVQSLPKADVISREAVSDVITLVNFTPLLFGDVLEQLSIGKVSLESAKRQVDKKYSGS